MCSSEVQISTLPCPLCCQPNFSSVDSLRTSLISVTNRPLNCPICKEILLGLDKLTIHLFSHSMQANVEPQQRNASNQLQQQQQQIKEEPVQSDQSLVHQYHHQLEQTAQNESPLSNQLVFQPSTKMDTMNSQMTTDTSDKSKQQTQETPLKAIRLRRRRIKAIKLENENINLNNKLYTTANDQVPQCHVCGYTFRTQQLQQMHMRLVHEIFPDTLAAVINENNDDSETASYLGQISGILINGNRFQCHLCTKYFKMKGSLRLHLRVVHGIFPTTTTTVASQHQSPSNLNDIPATNNNLPSNAGFSASNHEFNDRFTNETNDHLAIETAALSLSTSTSSTSLSLSPTIGNAMTITTTAAPTAFIPMDNNNLSNVKTENRPISINNNSNNSHSDSNNSENNTNADAKLWDCDICAKSFTTKYFLKKHKRLHTGEMPYTCEICCKTFTFQQSYHKHLLYHSDDKPHTCTICGRAFKELSTLHNHERIHSGEKPFKCETCDKCFRQRVSYLVHRRIHTGVMPYKCTICDKSFRYKVSQRTHKCLAQVQGSQIQELNELVLQSSPKESKSSTSMHIDQPLAAVDTNSANIHLLPHTSAGSLSSDINSETSVPETGIINTPNHMNYFQNTSSIMPNQGNDHLQSLDDPNLTNFTSNQTLDDFVAESYNKMGLDDHIDQNLPLLFDETNAMFQSTSNQPSPNQIPSPSEKFQNLCLYSDSPQILDRSSISTTSHDSTVQSMHPLEPVSLSSTELFNETLATINEDSLKQLLYGHSENDNNLV